MAVAASGQGGAMIRVDPQQSAALIEASTASVVEMRGSCEAERAGGPAVRPPRRRALGALGVDLAELGAYPGRVGMLEVSQDLEGLPPVRGGLLRLAGG
jgi:hypothetical protein